MAGPGIAAEIVVGFAGGTGMRVTGCRCTPTGGASADLCFQLVVTTSDVVGAETSSAYKNLAAIAVGIAEGLSEHLIESAYV